MGRFEQVGFGGSFMVDAEAVELHAAAVGLPTSQTRSRSLEDLIWETAQAASHESREPY